MSLFARFFHPRVAEEDVRAEIWRLGSRHLGEPLTGALSELKAGDLSTERADLLRACVHRLRAKTA